MSASKLKAVGVKLPYAQKFFPESVAVENTQMDGVVQPSNSTLDGRSFDIKADFFDLKFSKKKIIVTSFKTLTTDFCKKMKSNVIIRGLRATSDFEYEFQLAGMNRKLNNKIETIFLMSDVKNQIISSRLIKEVAELNLSLIHISEPTRP